MKLKKSRDYKNTLLFLTIYSKIRISMKELENAKLLYGAFINRHDDKYFLIGFIDYFDYLISNRAIFNYFEGFLENNKEQNKAYAELIFLAQEEFRTTYNYIKSKYEDLKITDEVIDHQLLHIDRVLSGEINMSPTYPQGLTFELILICQNLADLGHVDFIKNHADVLDIYHNPFVNSLILPAYAKLTSQTDIIKKSNEASIETCFIRLSHVYESFKKITRDAIPINKNKHHLKDELNEFLNYSILTAYYGEVFDPSYRNRHNENFFLRSNLLDDVQRLHAYILVNSNQRITNIINNVVTFDKLSSKLTCNGNEIKLTKGKGIYYIIKYIFERENIYEECFYDEIKEHSELDKSKKLADKNIYDNLLRFKNRLSKENHSDIFNISSHSITISNKYIVKN